MNKQELLELKDEIDEANNKLAELRGRKKSTMERLSQLAGVATIEEAEKVLAKMQKEYKKAKVKNEKAMEALHEQLEEIEG